MIPAARDCCRSIRSPQGDARAELSQRLARSDPTDEICGRGQGRVPGEPVGRTRLVRVLTDVLRGPDLAEQLHGVATDVPGVELDELDAPVGIGHERAALGETVFLDEHAEVAAD